MISHRILGCLFLILLSQYSDAWKAHYVEILNSLQRIEHLLLKQTLKCLPTEKLFDLISEASTVSNSDSNEIQPKYGPAIDPNIILLLKELGLDRDVIPSVKKSKERYKNKDYENVNALNTNINKNINRARRVFEDSKSLKPYNRNDNIHHELNVNKHRRGIDLADLSDEAEA